MQMLSLSSCSKCYQTKNKIARFIITLPHAASSIIAQNRSMQKSRNSKVPERRSKVLEQSIQNFARLFLQAM
jgi:hypothetical protein